jgi:hypothetical protein
MKDLMPKKISFTFRAVRSHLNKMRLVMRIGAFVLIGSLIAPVPCLARNPVLTELENTIEKVEYSVPRPGMYLAPNELKPELAVPLFRNVPSGGVYMAVGTERGLITAALKGDFSSVILVDSDPDVVRYNRLNVAFLAMSENREDYLYLRYHATHEEVLARSRKADLSEQLRLTIEDRESLNWWIQEIRRDPDTLALLNWKRPGFETTSYLHIDALFERVQSLAKRGEIYVVFADLQNRIQVSRIAMQISKSQSWLSLVDISNAWWADYMELQGIRVFVDGIYGAMKKESVFLMTHLMKKSGDWGYFGIQLSKMHGVLDRSFYGYDALKEQFSELEATHPKGDGVFIGRAPTCENVFMGL